MKRNASLLVLTLFALTLLGTNAFAQAVGVFAGGLKAPVRIILTPGGNLLVAESGTGHMDGRISIIDKSGSRRTLVDGLPSAINLSGGEPAPSGPAALVLRGRTLYVVIGSGDATLPGPAPGSEIPNPQPTSTLFSSVLALRFPASVDISGGDFAFTASNYANLAGGGKLKTSNSSGERLVADVLVNFRDFADEPRPDLPNNVRASNPFGADIRGNALYVADASENLVYRVDLDTGDSEVLARFGPKPNPLPFGPPVMEAVPNNVRVFGKQLLVPFLMGFPFAQGSAEIRKVNLANDSQATFIGGLTSAIDVLPVTGAQGQDQFYTLEFSTDMLANAPGRLQFFSSPGATPTVVAAGIPTPISLARDQQTNAIYISSIFTGNIFKVQGVQ
ncbi:MAG TPA: ScyD/ScyE family protein [Blastocatellia bacterium]|nr:ScyD/ScyE family protein [Blastocatellia bacterium]